MAPGDDGLSGSHTGPGDRVIDVTDGSLEFQSMRARQIHCRFENRYLDLSERLVSVKCPLDGVNGRQLPRGILIERIWIELGTFTPIVITRGEFHGTAKDLKKRAVQAARENALCVDAF